jgi:hypothetical protein
MFLLGMYFRDKYILGQGEYQNFLNESLINDQIRISSTDVTRTL